MLIELPWPARDMWPNARAHRLAVAPIRAAYRRTAWALCREAMGLAWCPPKGKALHLTVTFCAPDKRKRDIDNMLAAIKSGLDGVADATGCDDSLWGLTLQRGPVALGGAVRIIIATPEAPGIPYRGTIE